MEKINIAKLLKDCPKGMELDCTVYEDVYFDYVDELNIIHCYIQHETYKTSIIFNQYGNFNSVLKTKCVIFPKNKTTWEGFVTPYKFEDGDILISWLDGSEGNPFIFKQINGFGNAKCYCAINCFGELIFNSDNWTSIKGCKLATPKDKEKLFDAIKENGYKWNAETKTLEKLIEPKFKVGDRIRRKGETSTYTITYVNDAHYFRGEHVICDTCDDDWELAPNKFDINTLKPFESKVLIRDYDDKIWMPTFWGKLLGDDFYCRYLTTNGCYKYCIPYKGNEYLLGTTEDCNDFYKTW